MKNCGMTRRLFFPLFLSVPLGVAGSAATAQTAPSPACAALAEARENAILFVRHPDLAEVRDTLEPPLVDPQFEDLVKSQDTDMCERVDKALKEALSNAIRVANLTRSNAEKTNEIEETRRRIAALNAEADSVGARADKVRAESVLAGLVIDCGRVVLAETDGASALCADVLALLPKEHPKRGTVEEWLEIARQRGH